MFTLKVTETTWGIMERIKNGESENMVAIKH